jgi:hypothetical protein
MLAQQFIHTCNESDFVSPLDPLEASRVFYDRAYFVDSRRRARP